MHEEEIESKIWISSKLLTLNYLKGDITRTTRIKNLYTQIGICFTHDELRGLSSYLFQGEIRTSFDT
jgi:hypothetical protein